MFRLKSLRLENHYKFGNINLDFCDYGISKSSYFTIVIGENGSGKSLIIETIINIFNIISESQLKIYNSSDLKFRIEYYSDNTLYYYSNINDIIDTNIVNNKSFPAKIIANTFSANDRFPFIDKRRIEGEKSYFENAYEYLGLRTIPNAIYKGSNLKRLLYSLINISQKIDKLINLQVLFDNINFEKIVYFSLKAGRDFKINSANNKVYKLISDPLTFKDYFQELIDSKYSTYSTKKNRYYYIKKFIDDKETLERSSIFLRRLLVESNFMSKKHDKIRYRFDFNDLSSFAEIREFSTSIELLTELDILNIEDVSFVKDSTELGTYKISSGEFNILSSIINIASKIEDNSLIIIDEPEISLHPEWQIKYINTLQNSFNNYNNVHFFISTHSHFLLSDLYPSSSKILILKRNNNQTEVKYFNESTYAKSAEEILLEVFEIPTTRNYYLSDLIGNILEKMADPTTDDVVIRKEIEKLSYLNIELLSDADPLKDVISSLTAKLK